MHGKLRPSMCIAIFPVSRLARDELDRIANDKGFGNRIIVCNGKRSTCYACPAEWRSKCYH